MSEWTIDDADKMYHISRWGEGYFGINKGGNLTVCPKRDTHQIDINEVIKEMKEQNVSFPAVIRFHDILRDKVKTINKTFRKIIDEANYEGRFYGVFPIKVNQMREVVEEIVDAGASFDFGLEAGSKPELLTVLAYNQNQSSLTILNGYKDTEFLRLALMGTQIGKRFIIVIEKFSELQRLINLSKEMGVKPLIGLRTKMSVEGTGRWAHSSGEKAKFGLTTSEMLLAGELLKENGLESQLKLIHFHIGSQINDIRTLKDAITEGARTYAKLSKLGFDIEYFDVGGGLGVDYDGSRSSTDSSTNYSLEEYITDIVWNLKQICDLEGVDHPNIVTETGRALTAHHSCLVTNVMGEISSHQTPFSTKKQKGEHILVSNMRELSKELTAENYQQMYNEAAQLKMETLQAFRLGILSLEERAKIETLYWKIVKKIQEHIENQDEAEVPEELLEITNKLATQYLCNFSVFQSAADTWAINQILPIVPLTRLNEKPTKNCSIADITCDSDGKIDHFIEHSNTLPLHKLNDGEEYLIGLFLTGAYQDVMGDMHNLFGRLNEVHVYSDPGDPAGFYIEEIIRGNSASNVLSTMQYHPEYMAHTMKKMVNKEVLRGHIPPRTGVQLVDFYEDCLADYTYLKL